MTSAPLAPRRKPGGWLAVKHRRFFVNKAQRHELGDAAGAFLNFAENVQMNRFIARAFDIAVHDRRGSWNADLVRGLDQLDPLRNADPAR